LRLKARTKERKSENNGRWKRAPSLRTGIIRIILQFFLLFLFFSLQNFLFSPGTRGKDGPTAPPPCTRSSGRHLLLHLMMIKRSAKCDKRRVVKLHIFLRISIRRNKLCKRGSRINSRNKFIKFKFNSIPASGTLEWIYRNLI
jgi:hypothetical protein